MGKVDTPNAMPYSLRQDSWDRNTRKLEEGLFFGRICKEAEMPILCYLHDNGGFICLGKAGGIGNGG